MIIPLFKTTKHCPKCGSERLEERNTLLILDNGLKSLCESDTEHKDKIFLRKDVLVVKWIQESEHERIIKEQLGSVVTLR